MVEVDVEDEVCLLVLLLLPFLVDSLAGSMVESAPESGESECFLFELLKEDVVVVALCSSRPEEVSCSLPLSCTVGVGSIRMLLVEDAPFGEDFEEAG